MNKNRKNYKQTLKKSQKRIDKTIINYLKSKPNLSFNYKQILANADLINLISKQKIIMILDRLALEGSIEKFKRGKYRFVSSKADTVGRVDIIKSGSAYVNSQDFKEDIYISYKNINRALDGDTVKVLVFKRNKRDRLEGKIIKIIKRAKTQFVGRFVEQDTYGIVVSDKRSKYPDIFIDKNNFGKAKGGQKVVAIITKWKSFAKNPNGKIIRVLGSPGENEVEINAILVDYNLPYKFPKEVELESKKILTSISKKEISRRKDLRDILTFTIDPEDAKDFDDAISYQELKNGNIEIGVHIADVSHYVKPGSLLDKEAYQRANSVYLVDRVISMLPEKISNNICSLIPKKEKLTFSAIFEFDEKANIKKQWFGKTIIFSDKRFTYSEAQEALENKQGDFANSLERINFISKILRKQRIENGALIFNKLEVKFELNEQNNPIRVFFKQAKDSNHLIEEFMLLTNKKIAEYLSLCINGTETGNTVVYRVHDEPDFEKLENLKRYVSQLGYSIDIQNRQTVTKSLNKLLNDVKGKPESFMIETLIIRSMSKAKYSTENKGHYGLAINHYVHFTSPIRRYPDLLIHRLLNNYLKGLPSPSSKLFKEYSEHCSEREKISIEAQRESTKYMQVKYIEKYIGEIFSGNISGITEWGMFVELQESKAEGLVSLHSIKEDNFVFDKKNFCLEGKFTKKKFIIGDSVTIQITDTNLDAKQINLKLIL